MSDAPFLSIVIPVHNEAENIRETCETICMRFEAAAIDDYEILVVNDHSTDDTRTIVDDLAKANPVIRCIDNTGSRGFGMAVRCGIDAFRGEAMAVVMGDLSDSPDDILVYYQELKDGAECVFGSRFIKGSQVHAYPRFKWILNRFANAMIRLLFRLEHNDITNAFKAYRREVIDGMQPLLSSHFNLTVEMPLKAIIRGYRYTKVPVSWTNRRHGKSKLKLREMGSRYMFIVLYCWLENLLSRRDYRRPS